VLRDLCGDTEGSTSKVLEVCSVRYSGRLGWTDGNGSSPESRKRESPWRGLLQACAFRSRELVCKLRLDEAETDGIADETGRLMDVELLDDVTAVGFSSLCADAQVNRHLLRGFAFGNQLQNLSLAWTQNLRWCRVLV